MKITDENGYKHLDILEVNKNETKDYLGKISKKIKIGVNDKIKWRNIVAINTQVKTDNNSWVITPEKWYLWALYAPPHQKK